MPGPKLDARTYAIAVLIVVSVLLSTKLIAQGGSPYVGSSADNTAVASANREIASALSRMADSNAKIAESIGDLAKSVRDAGDKIAGAKHTAPAEGSSASGDYVPAGESGEVDPDKTPAGTFQMK